MHTFANIIKILEMHRIYFDNRRLTICSSDWHSINDPNATLISCDTEEEISKIPDFFDKNKNIQKLYLVTDKEREVYNLLCQQFKEIDAAGGLVKNRAGDYLMIFRRDKWDLPKGKREDGEDYQTNALREVQEETGLEDLILKEKICVTHHVYHLNGNFILKHTHWFNMLYDKPVDLIPQTEEDINIATWIAKSSLSDKLNNTYPSIIEVFKKAHVI